MTQPAPTADLILHRGLFTTLARAHPTATAVAIRDGASEKCWLIES
jgi:predicted amidohydrolase YtcJ